VQEWSTDIDYT